MTLLEALRAAKQAGKRAAIRESPILKRVYVAYSETDVRVLKYVGGKQYGWKSIFPGEVMGFDDWKPDEKEIF